MTRLISALILIALACTLIAQTPATHPASTSRFVTCDILIDSGPTPLAAWQIDVQAAIRDGTVELVGVEGAEPSSVYAAPAFYDPEALTRDHVVLAAFSTAKPETLPTGNSRVARLHLRITGDHAAAPNRAPTFTVKLIAAADPAGAPFSPTPTASLGDNP